MATREHGTVSDADDGIRLDLWLSKHTTIPSRSKARKALATGKVSVGEEQMGVGDAGRMLAAGNKVTLDWSVSGNANAAVRLARAGVDLLYSDHAVVVANKPAGLLTDTATRAQFRERDSLRKQLRARFEEQVYPAHRIDRDTTGVVAFARSLEAQQAMRAQWAERTPERVYIAIVEGRVREEGGRWADWMAWDAKRRLQCPSKEGAKHAVLAEADWSVLHRGQRTTAVEIRLISGRRNQIRVHAMLRGHPIVGETQYRRGAIRVKGARRQALHASKLAFLHPVSRARVEVVAPLPADMRRFLPESGS